MNDLQRNPFDDDADRRAIWDALMRRDFEAFIAADWSMVADDFVPTGFYGIDARRDANPQNWALTFPTIASYRDAWIAQAKAFGPVELVGVDKLTMLYRAARLDEIEITGDNALARKKFDGRAEVKDGEPIVLRWQTLYVMRKVDGRWRIAGFVGYLPYDAAGGER